MSISAEALIRRCQQAASMSVDGPPTPDGLIGFFQQFRPDGRGLAGLWDDVDAADELYDRIERLYAAAGDDRLGQRGRDAYFVVRKFEPIDPIDVGALGQRWLRGLTALSRLSGDVEVTDQLTPPPSLRVLQGIPPKHPRQAIEKSRLLQVFQDRVPAMVNRLAGEGTIAATLRPAYYFTACDPLLRDYLMWPLYQSALTADAIDDGRIVDDGLSAYFGLWRHGIKYRIFGDAQIDLYLPRSQHGPAV